MYRRWLDLDTILLESLENADVSQPLGRATAQGERDP